MDAVLESTIEKNLFIVPIRATASLPRLWNTVSMAAVQTRESLQRGFDGTGSYYELEKTYSPALDVSGLYIFIPLPK